VKKRPRFSAAQPAIIFTRDRYSPAARYAILTGDRELLGKIILLTYSDEIQNGSYNELRVWFDALEEAAERRAVWGAAARLSLRGGDTLSKYHHLPYERRRRRIRADGEFIVGSDEDCP